MNKSTKFKPMYAKVFKSMFDGTLRGRSDALLVFVNLLANSDREGFVDKHFLAISQETGLSVERVVAATLELESSDRQSRSQELEGRRLERMDAHREWGWRIVNYGKYRKLRDEDDRREYNRVKQKESRAAKGVVIEKLDLQIPNKLNTPAFISVWGRWLEFRRGYRKPNSWGDMFREQLEWLSKMSVEDATESLQQSMRNGWQGLFEPKTYGKNNSTTHPKSANRNTGTLNEGKSSQYRGVGKMV